MSRKPVQKLILKNISSKKPVKIDQLVSDIGDKLAVNRSIKTLSEQGLIESLKSDTSDYIRLTDDGIKKINQMALDSDSALVSHSWDGFWRIILLDLPESRKSEREALRYLLKKAGFVCIKNSVWISMYPYEHLFTNIKKDLNLTTELMIIVTQQIDSETEKEFFELVK